MLDRPCWMAKECESLQSTAKQLQPLSYFLCGGRNIPGGGGGGALPINGLMGMCRWMGSHFHDWTDYNGVAFSSTFYRVTRMGSHFSGILRERKFWQVVIYKRKDSPKRKSYRIHCCCLIFDKRLPLSD